MTKFHSYGHGNDGQTQLLDCTRLPKYSQRIRALAAMDILQANIGLAASYTVDWPRDILRTLICDLTRVMTDLGITTLDRAKQLKRPVDVDMLDKLDGYVAQIQQMINPPRTWYTPGGHTVGAHVNFARALCRAAEVEVATLIREVDGDGEVEGTGEYVGINILPYMNKLSTLLYYLTLLIEKKQED